MKKLFSICILLLLFVLISSDVEGQNDKLDSLVSIYKDCKDTEQKADLAMEIATIYYRELDPKVFTYVKEAIELGKKANTLKKVANSYRLYGYSELEINQNRKKELELFKKSYYYDSLADNSHGMVKSLYALGGGLGDKGDYNESLLYLQKALSIFDSGEIDCKKCKKRVYVTIGSVLVNSKNDNEAITNFRYAEELALELNDTLSLGTIYQQLGIAFSNLKEINKSHEYTLKAYDFLQGSKRYTELYAIEMNLAASYMRIDSLKKAKEYAQMSLQNFKNKGIKDGMTRASLTLGEIHYKLKEYKKAESNYLYALDLAQKFESKPKEMTAHAKLNVLYKSMGKFEKALYHLEQNHKIESGIFSVEKERELSEIKLKLESERKKKELAQKDAKIQAFRLKEEKEQQQRKIIYSGVILLIISSLFVIQFQRVRNKKNKEILLKEKEVEKLKVKEARSKVDHLSKELNVFTQNLSEKNSFINQLEEKLEQLEKNDVIGSMNREEALSELYSFKILTDEDWVKFKDLYNKVHEGQLLNIRKKYPTLTQAEERLILLLKINFTTSEISGITGVSINSVRKSRQRLRNKLQLDADVVLEEFVATL